MRRFILGLAMTGIATLSPALLLASDQETAQQIADGLRGSGQLVDYSIGVKYQNGTAWLLGRVASQEQRETAESLAHEMDGVTRVVNKLGVEQSSQVQAQGRILNNTTSEPAVIRLPLQGRRTGSPVVRAAVDSSRQDAVETAGLETDLEGSELPELAAPEEFESPQPTLAPVVRSANKARNSRRVRAVAQRRGHSHAAQQAPLGQAVAGQATLPPGSQPAFFIPAPNGQQGGRNQRPIPLQARRLQHGGPGMEAMPVMDGVQGGPIPTYLPGASQGVAPARYDHPHMPNHAWPSYAAYPNYAGVSYPKQYSPTAWPYIGPFYPYPQVPLGWRKVTLEWDDGWWMLDFDD